MDNAIIDKYQAVIGLEVHIQLLTISKLFAADSNHYGDAPNTNISTITLAHPGTLPKLNKRALELAVRMGLVCGSHITQKMIFDRKNYFYPDLPKGYQLTQDSTPICVGGSITIATEQGARELTLNRIHLEEDAGKSFHLADPTSSLVDFNRAGTPLIELVTEPVLHHPEEAYQLLYEIRKLVTHLEICDGNMEEGSMRCDANVSIRRLGSEELGSKVEIKNMNSLRNVRRAITQEIIRQVELAESKQPIPSETRTFNEKTGGSASMRTKEELNDYRYFPEPDLSPVIISDDWLASIKASLPTLPNELMQQVISTYGFSQEDAVFLTDSKNIYGYFQETLQLVDQPAAILNWLKGPVQSYLKEHDLRIIELNFKPKQLSELIQLVKSGQVSFSQAAQHLLPVLLRSPERNVLATANELGLIQSQDKDKLESDVVQVIEAFPEKVQAFKNGKKGLMGFFMGQLMQKKGSKIDPKVASELFSKHLN